MNVRRFGSAEELAAAAVELLARHIAPRSESGPRALMLSGGNTPRPAYRALAAAGVVAAPNLRFFLSDERHVPPDRPESNFGQMKALFAALAVPDDHLVAIRTERPLENAAEQYDRDLKDLLQQGARITLGLLGLGSDGHTASLFSQEDIRRGDGRLAVAVPRPNPPHRISVTPGLLARIEEIVFLVAGRDKADIAQRLQDDPDSLPAGRAVSGARNVSLWLA